MSGGGGKFKLRCGNGEGQKFSNADCHYPVRGSTRDENRFRATDGMSPGAAIQVGRGSAGILPAPVGILPTGLEAGIWNHRSARCDAAWGWPAGCRPERARCPRSPGTQLRKPRRNFRDSGSEAAGARDFGKGSRGPRGLSELARLTAALAYRRAGQRSREVRQFGRERWDMSRSCGTICL
jgi:hypothetical protein